MQLKRYQKNTFDTDELTLYNITFKQIPYEVKVY